MTVKKAKGVKSDSRSKKRSQTASSSSSLSIDDKKLNQVDNLGVDLGQQISTEDAPQFTDVIDDTSMVDPLTDSMVFTDEPKLTTLIIEKHDGEMSGGHFDGYGKSYFVNGNIYEGMFCGGTMQGKGRYEWTSEGIIYEGDFCNNEITGRGKYNWPDGSTYVGDVVQGIRNGNGVYTHLSGKLYSGGWVNGKRHGIGIMNYDTNDISFYEGEWRYNVIEGEGFRQYRSGNNYKGDWYLGKRHGHGTMKWLDRNEQYTGQWKNGVQNGYGRHIWFVKRIEGSQYSLRNIYEGDFVNGKRHGYGVFIYASGARYVGNWLNNMKCGQGTFIFKNGRSYEGEFDNDRMVEFPNVSISGRDSPDVKVKRIRQSMQDDVDNLSARTSICSFNTTSPSFLLCFDHLLNDPYITCPEEEMIQIQNAVLGQLASIRKIYQYYSSLGDQTYSIDNTAAMNQMQFWRFLKDCRLHYDGGPTLAKIDRVLAESINVSSPDDVHNPMSTILLLRFISYIVTIGHYVFSSSYNYDDVAGTLLATCFNDIIQKNILPYACNVGGIFYSDIKKTGEILKHFNPMYEVYKEFCYQRKEYPFDNCMRLRDFLIIMKKLELINNNLTAVEIVRILSLDDPNVTDEQFVCLENEITFYEFCEALIQCASVFITREMINDFIDPKPSSAKSTIRSDNLEDSETEHTMTMSRPITGESNKQDNIDTDDKSNNRSKPQSGKTKISSADSSNAKTRKQDPADKTGPKKVHKSSKGPKATNAHSRKQSMDKDSNARKQSLMPSEVDDKMSIVAGVNANDNEFSVEETNRPKSDVIAEIREFNGEQEFNYWTHQTHLFLTKYYFPAAEKYFSISKRIEEKDLANGKEKQRKSSEEIFSRLDSRNDNVLLNVDDNLDTVYEIVEDK